MSRRLSRIHVLAALALGLAAAQCNVILGLDKYVDGTGNGGAGAGTTASSTSSTTTASSSGQGGGSDGGTGGSGACTPNQAMACYTGPAGTEGVGECIGGMETCAADGSGYGSCLGQVLPKPEDCYTIGDENCDGNACSDPVWDLAFTDTSGEPMLGMAVDSMGDVYLAGYSVGTIAVDSQTFSVAHAGHQQYYLLKISHQAPHHLLWQKFLGDGNDNGALIQVAVDPSDNVIVSGELYSSIVFGGTTMTAPTGQDSAFVAQYGTDGTYNWGQLFGDAQGAEADQLAIDSQGNIIVIGQSYGNTIDFTTTSVTTPGTFVALFKSTGANVWSLGLGALTNAAAAAGTGNTFVTGTFSGTLKLGAQTFTSKGGTDVFLSSLDATGTPTTSAAYGSPGNDGPSSISVNAAGTVAIAGVYGGTINFGTTGLTLPSGTSAGFIATFDSTLAPVWSKGFAGSPVSAAIVLDTKGDAFVAGHLTGSTNFGAGMLTGAGLTEAYLAKFDPTGAVLWNKLFDTQAVNIPAVSIDRSTGNVVIAGDLTGSTSFGLAPLLGANNAFIAEFQY